MKIVCSILVLLMTLAARGQERIESNTGGLELAAKLRSLAPAENTEVSGVLNIRRRGQDLEQVPLLTRVRVGSSGWEAVYRTRQTPQRPAEHLVIRHTPNKPNEYLYVRGAQADNPQPVSHSQLAMPFAGSDFWLMDLGLEFLHWPVQRLVKLEKPAMRKGRPCDKLDSVNPNPAPGAYARVVSFIDKESGGLIVAEAFDQENRSIKEFSVRSVKKVQGEWQLNEMEMTDKRAGSTTRIDFDVENGKR